MKFHHNILIPNWTKTVCNEQPCQRSIKRQQIQRQALYCHPRCCSRHRSSESLSVCLENFPWYHQSDSPISTASQIHSRKRRSQNADPWYKCCPDHLAVHFRT